MKIALIAQIVTLVLAIVAVAWGVMATYSVAFPGPSGEWAGIGVFAAAVVDVPVGLLCLIVGLAVKQGSPRLRRMCVVLSLIALSLPIVAQLIWHRGRW